MSLTPFVVPKYSLHASAISVCTVLFQSQPLSLSFVSTRDFFFQRLAVLADFRAISVRCGSVGDAFVGKRFENKCTSGAFSYVVDSTRLSFCTEVYTCTLLLCFFRCYKSKNCINTLDNVDLIRPIETYLKQVFSWSETTFKTTIHKRVSTLISYSFKNAKYTFKNVNIISNCLQPAVKIPSKKITPTIMRKTRFSL